MSKLDNANPTVYEATKDRIVLPEEEDEDVTDLFDDREVFGTDFTSPFSDVEIKL